MCIYIHIYIYILLTAYTIRSPMDQAYGMASL